MARFCNSPWTQLSISPDGQILPCCRYNHNIQKNYPYPKTTEGNLEELWNGDKIKKLRQAFLDGIEPEECNDCWVREKTGLTSMREDINRWTNYKEFKDTNAPPPSHYDLKTTNVCNLRCRMCGGTNSSMILKEWVRYNESNADNLEVKFLTSHKILNKKNNKIWKKWLPSIEQILIAGGEPFKCNESKELIKSVIDSKVHKDVYLDIVTNGSYFQEELVKEIINFKGSTIHFSLDDLYERNEYARDKSNWDNIENNIIKFKYFYV